MGNKISLGDIVIYCGFPGKRRRTKKKEEEKRRQMAAQEAFETYLRAERWKAENPEYGIQAGLSEGSQMSTPFEWGDWSNHGERAWDAIIPPRLDDWVVECKKDEELKLGGMPAVDRSKDVGSSRFSHLFSIPNEPLL